MYKNKKAIRVIALILAILMVLGLAVVAIEALASDIPTTVEETEQTIGGEELSAEALTPTVNVTPELPSGYFYLTDPTKTTQDISGLIPHLDTVTQPIRVGVFYIYGSNNCLAFSHNITSTKGGLVMYSTFGDEYTFYKTSDVGITVMRDFSAKKGSSGSYYHTTTDNTHIIYHCITQEPVQLTEVDSTIENYKSILGGDATVFPLYVSGKAYIAVGTYANKDASAADCDNLQSVLGVGFVPRTPNNTSISVIETASGKILFKIDTADQALYVRPLQNYDSENYIKSAVGNLFDGTFEYKTTISGMYLVNILDIEDYVKSVLPYEISASWPDECLKAFSVVVRSYTLSMLGKSHRQQDFDMCDETHCQAYRGRLRSTNRTDAAVEATKNIVLAYDSKICEAFYHAISGGVTESCEKVWGGTGYPYLVSQEVPDEKYWDYTYGIWSFEVSEQELFNYLQSNSTVSRYVKHPITGVRVSKYTDAGYAFELEITDSSGTVSTFTKCDNIRTILSKYAKSSRLTIGKSTEVTVNGGETITIDPYNIVQTDKDGKPVISTTAVGSTVSKSVISGTGEVKELPVTESSTYVISGTGWGHGVGLSQYGARDMANNGYLWNEIATYFFPGAYLANLHNLSVDVMTEPEAPIVPEEPEEPEEPVTPVTPTEPDDEGADEDEKPTEEDDEIIVIPGSSAFDGPIKVI
ncbi:MAG: SpoIID/LytB domain-containing protein [Clostridia bacterium]|nr:SpoIID/LytB domain-containing protein [Clostridia bacterium]